MVAGEVREECDIEVDAGHALLIQTYGGDFHANRTRTALQETREFAVQPYRVRRGIEQRRKASGIHAVAERPDDTARHAVGAQCPRYPLTTRCLAVGAGDADRP